MTPSTTAAPWQRRFRHAWWYPLWVCSSGLQQLPRNVRGVLCAVVESSTLEVSIMLVTITNCIFLAMANPRDDGPNKVQDDANLFFTAAFGLEFALKICAWGPRKYLSEPWNVLDVLVLAQGLMSLAINTNLSALKALRVLRALGAVKRIPQLRIIVSALLKSLPSLKDIALVTMLYVFLLSLFGTLLWQGLFKYRCVDAQGNDYETDTGMALLCGAKYSQGDTSAGSTCASAIDITDPLRCPPGYTCDQNLHSPNFGLTSFDNVAVAAMNFFQVITQEAWSEILFYTQMTMSFQTFIIFVVVILSGGGVLVNLMIAAMMARLQDALTTLGDKALGQEAVDPEKNTQTADKDGSDPSTPTTEPGSGAVVKAHQRKQRLPRWHPVNVLVSGVPLDFLTKQVQTESSIFNIICLSAIMVNVTLMTLDAHSNPKSMTRNLEIANHYVSWVFVGEAVVRLTATGLTYFCTAGNVFDCLIVGGFLLETMLAGSGSVAALRVLRFLRLIRLLRMGRLARKYPSFMRVMKILGGSFQTSWPIVLILFLFTFVYSILALELFGAQLPLDPYIRFDGFYWSFINSFMILTGESWPTIFRACMRVSAFAPVFFVSWIILGQYVLLNLVMAVILGECGKAMNEGSDQPMIVERMNRCVLRYRARMCMAHWRGIILADKLTADDLRAILKASDQYFYLPSADPFLLVGLYHQDKQVVLRLVNKVKTRTLQGTGEALEPVNTSVSTVVTRSGTHKRQMLLKGDIRAVPAKEWLREVVVHPYFQNLILITIVVNTIAMAAAPPRGADPQWLTAVNIASVVLFVAEIVLKCVVDGVWRGRMPFFRDGSNLLDFTITFFMLIKLLLETLRQYAVSDLCNIVLSMRPMRVVLRIASLREMLKALASSVASLTALAGVLIFCMYGYALVGVQLFKGSFYTCSDTSLPPGSDLSSCNGTVTNNFFNFDDVGQGMVSVFVMCSVSGWSGVLYPAIASVGQWQQPMVGSNYFAFPFMFLGVCFFGFFMMQMVIGVVFERFQSMRAVRPDGKKVSDTLKAWEEQQKRILKMQPLVMKVPPRNRLRRFFFDLTRHTLFEQGIMLVIMLNAATLCLQGVTLPTGLTVFLERFDIFVAILFALEALFKVIALGTRYFGSANLFDLLITSVGLVDLMVTNILQCGNSKLILFQLLRSLRVFRLLRLIKFANSLRIIFRAIVAPLPRLGMVMVVIGAVLFFFSNIAMLLFAHVTMPSPIEYFANFKDLVKAMLLLFIFGTGELWDSGMQAISDYPTDGLTPVFAHLYKPIAIIFLVLLQVCVKILLMNLFVLVIVEAYAIMLGEQGGIPEPLLVEFLEAWRDLDPGGQGAIEKHEVYKLMARLPPALGFPASVRFRDKLIRVTEMDLPEGPCKFHRVLQRIQDYVFEQVHNQERLIERLEVVKAFIVVQRAMRRHSALRARRRSNQQPLTATAAQGGPPAAGKKKSPRRKQRPSNDGSARADRRKGTKSRSVLSVAPERDSGLSGTLTSPMHSQRDTMGSPRGVEGGDEQEGGRSRIGERIAGGGDDEGTTDR